jgi:hypothetical protein
MKTQTKNNIFVEYDDMLFGSMLKGTIVKNDV